MVCVTLFFYDSRSHCVHVLLLCVYIPRGGIVGRRRGVTNHPHWREQVVRAQETVQRKVWLRYQAFEPRGGEIEIETEIETEGEGEENRSMDGRLCV